MTKREQLYAKLENEWKEYKKYLLRQPPEIFMEYLREYIHMTDVLHYIKHLIIPSGFGITYDDDVIDDMLDNDITLSDICDEIDIVLKQRKE